MYVSMTTELPSYNQSLRLPGRVDWQSFFAIRLARIKRISLFSINWYQLVGVVVSCAMFVQPQRLECRKHSHESATNSFYG